jgi:hypothetical protein
MQADHGRKPASESPWPPPIGATVTMAEETYVVTSTVGNRAYGRLATRCSGREYSLIKRLVEVEPEQGD